MTISPGERHNYLATRLSRYHLNDPFVAPKSSAENPAAEEARVREERKWIDPDRPSLVANSDDVFEVDIPGCDMRRLIQARDPSSRSLFV